MRLIDQSRGKCPFSPILENHGSPARHNFLCFLEAFFAKLYYTASETIPRQKICGDEGREPSRLEGGQGQERRLGFRVNVPFYYSTLVNSDAVQGDPSGWLKPTIDRDLGCLVILPELWVATVAAHQLLEVSELSQRKVLTILMGHPVLRPRGRPREGPNSPAQ